MRRLSALLSLCLALFGWPLCGQGRTPVAVAAAADLRGALEAVKATFERAHPALELRLTFGASGSLAAQIRQGAPFDAFLSADLGFPEGLQAAGFGEEGGVFPYATGRLALWVRKDLGLDPASRGLAVLQAPAIRRIALANPAVAPYGRAAESALKSTGMLDALRPRLVFGENVAQAAQYLQTGAAEAGLVSVSQAQSPELRNLGMILLIPDGLYPPLRQGGMILKRCAVLPQARAFRQFLLGPEGQAILAHHGFGRP